MKYTLSDYQPHRTPKAVAAILCAILAVTLFSAIWESLFTTLIGWPPLQSLIALTPYGISHFFLWQYVTYLFVIGTQGAGITFFFLITVAFTLYMLWFFGSAIVDRGGTKEFLIIFFSSGILAALAATIGFLITGGTSFAGPFAPLLALFTIWCLLNPEMELLLFFTLPVKARILLAFAAAATILLNITSLTALLFYTTALFTGYAYAIIVWDLASPFPFLHPLDNALTAIARRIISLPQLQENGSKIVHILSGAPHLDDDAFIDAMLQKISAEGQDALTWSEKKRMDAIASKKIKD